MKSMLEKRFKLKGIEKIVYQERKNKARKTMKIGIIYFRNEACLLYTSDAADDMQCVDLGGRRIIKK